MFDLSFPEILVMLVVALIVLGPEKLPKFARFVGSTVNKIRGFGQKIQTDLLEQTQNSEIRNFGQSIKENVDDLTNQVKRNFSDLKLDIPSSEKYWGDDEKLSESENFYSQPTVPHTSIKLSLANKYRKNQRKKYKQQIKLGKKLSLRANHTLK